MLNLVERHPLKVMRIGFGDELNSRDVDGSIAHRKEERLSFLGEIQFNLCYHFFTALWNYFVGHITSLRWRSVRNWEIDNPTSDAAFARNA